MSQAGDIRQGLANALHPLVVSGLLGQVVSFTSSSWNPPCAFVADGEITYDLAAKRGLDELMFTVVVMVAYSEDESAVLLLDGFRAPSGVSSVKALLEADRTLGGKAMDAHVEKLSRPQLYERAGGPTALGAEWTVRVRASGQ